MKCPHCGLENPENTEVCGCGYDFIQKERTFPREPDVVQPAPNGLGDFFAFRKFITPQIIIALYILGAIIITLTGIIMFFSGFGDHAPELLILAGLATVILGNLSWRVTCEFLFLLFSIMKSADKRLKEKEPAKTS